MFIQKKDHVHNLISQKELKTVLKNYPKTGVKPELIVLVDPSTNPSPRASLPSVLFQYLTAPKPKPKPIVSLKDYLLKNMRPAMKNKVMLTQDQVSKNLNIAKQAVLTLNENDITTDVISLTSKNKNHAIKVINKFKHLTTVFTKEANLLQ
jgi:hypothetical protein